MHLKNVVSFVDAWVGFVGNGFSQELAQGLPAILRSMFQKIVLRNQRSYPLVVFDEAFPELVPVIPFATRLVSQDDPQEGQMRAKGVLITGISCGNIRRLQPDKKKRSR